MHRANVKLRPHVLHKNRCNGRSGSWNRAGAPLVLPLRLVSRLLQNGHRTRRFFHALLLVSGRLPDRYYENALQPGFLGSDQTHSMSRCRRTRSICQRTIHYDWAMGACGPLYIRRASGSERRRPPRSPPRPTTRGSWEEVAVTARRTRGASRADRRAPVCDASLPAHTS